MNELQEFLEPLRDMPDWVLRLALAATTLVLFYLFRRFFLRIVERWLHRALHRLKWDHTEAIVDALMIPARILVIAVALDLSLQILVPDRATREFASNLARSLVIVAGFVALFEMVDVFARNDRRLQEVIGFKIEDRLLPLIRTIIKLMLFVVAVIIVMGEWSIDVSGLLASLGIVGLAFSLAAQDTISNLFGFSTIIGDRPFLVGEYIRSGDVEGIVEKVGVRSTRIRKPDRAIITVPNNILATAPVERFRRRRIQFTLGVTYATTADQMEDLLERLRALLRSRPTVIDDTIAVYFTEFGSSSLDILVLCDVTLREWHAVMQERETVNLSIMRIVAELGLSVAFPTRSIYIDGLPEDWHRPPNETSL